MGIYFNPDNNSFTKATKGKIYVDKTGLLNELNRLLCTEGNCVAISHARRFGKSQAAGMIDAYYSLGSDSKELFAPFEISKAPDFEKHLNKYNVIHIDVSSAADYHKEDLVPFLIERLIMEFKEAFYEKINYNQSIQFVITDVFRLTGKPFVNIR